MAKMFILRDTRIRNKNVKANTVVDVESQDDINALQWWRAGEKFDPEKHKPAK